MSKADNLPPSCAVVTKSGNLKFLEPSGPVQACNGTDLFFNFLCFFQNNSCEDRAVMHILISLSLVKEFYSSIYSLLSSLKL